jgi:DNA-binding CsgD family transcriptional regulator/MFS family permease
MGRASLLEDLIGFWPGLRYLGLGFILAWFFLAYNFDVWLSDIEVDGSNLAAMFLFSTAGAALVLIVSSLLLDRADALIEKRSAIIIAGFVALLGNAGVILSGPYYLFIPWMFYVGSFVAGLGIGLLLLKAGRLYGNLPPRKSLIYALLSQAVVVMAYFVIAGSHLMAPIPGGPSLDGILALLLLPLLGAILLSVPAPNGGEERHASHLSFSHRLHLMPPVFWKFMVAVFVLSAAASVVRGFVVTQNQPIATVAISEITVLLTAVFALVFIGVAVHYKRQVYFGKLYLFIMILIAGVIAVCPLLDILVSPLRIIVSFAMLVFDFLVWCLLAFIVYQKRINAITVFGFGRGIFMVGCIVGWYVGTEFMPVVENTAIEMGMYIFLALLVLVASIIVFTEHDFNLLFTSDISEKEMLLEDLSPGAGQDEWGEQQQERSRPYLEACKAAGALAQLSAREQEVFEELARGRGSETIAKRLNISLNTVRTHTHNVYVKLAVHSRQELVELVETHLP